jgi:tetratricopeptide (TPR) repeat protein
MPAPSLLERLKRARIVQVLVVYLGASWGILQIADVLAEALSLPDWVLPVCVLLLLVGLIIIVATAWVQSLASTTAREEAGEIPTDWEVAPVQALKSLKSGKLPHLTWGRAILGGVMALSLLFGGAGLYVVVTGGQSFLGPEEAGATDSADGIAIVPFKISGGELEVWREGMVDLLATNLDGMGGYRTIDSRTVMARWREVVGDEVSPDLDVSLRAAGQTGARYAVVGSAVGVGSSLRLVAEVYDLADGREIGNGQVEGSPDEIMTLVDELSLETMRALLAGGGEELASNRNIANLTTHSLPALRAYLEGERHYRRAEFPQAVEAFERAIEEDSLFALALYRISDAYGWLESVNSDRAGELSAMALAAVDRLTPRNAVIVGASDGLYTNDLRHVEPLRAAVRKYPDDPEAWFMLAETFLHLGEATGATSEDAHEALLRAIELDPGFAPYYQHAADLATVFGDREEVDRVLSIYRDLAPDVEFRAYMTIARDMFAGDEEERAAAIDAMYEMTPAEMSYLWGTHGLVGNDDIPGTTEIVYASREVTGDPGFTFAIFRKLMNGGRWTHAEAVFNDSLPGDGVFAIDAYRLHRFTDRDDDRYLDLARGVTNFVGFDGAAAAIVAAEDGDEARLEVILTAQRAAGVAAREEGNLQRARDWETWVSGVEGYAQLHKGDAGLARATLERAQGKVVGFIDEFVRLWLAEANEELGRTQEALSWYNLLRYDYMTSHARYKMALLAEELGDLERARSEWEAFMKNYAEAEPDNPRLAEAREAMARLGG